jgi:hypothetical protein
MQTPPTSGITTIEVHRRTNKPNSTPNNPIDFPNNPPLYKLDFSGTDTTKSFYNSTYKFESGDIIHVFIYYTNGGGTNGSEYITVNLDLF